jgi:hypothetical protein
VGGNPPGRGGGLRGVRYVWCGTQWLPVASDARPLPVQKRVRRKDVSQDGVLGLSAQQIRIRPVSGPGGEQPEVSCALTTEISYDEALEKEYLEKVRTVRLPRLEAQRMEFLSEDFDPGNNWWGSKVD